ncbi:hypothetical protein JW835_14185 [bacterium]|nr:hypothetical protein [bacterium]
MRLQTMITETRGRISPFILFGLTVGFMIFIHCNGKVDQPQVNSSESDSTAVPAAKPDTLETDTLRTEIQTRMLTKKSREQEPELVSKRKDVEARMNRFLDLLEEREQSVMEKEQQLIQKEKRIDRLWIISIVLFILGIAALLVAIGLFVSHKKTYKSVLSQKNNSARTTGKTSKSVKTK